MSFKDVEITVSIDDVLDQVSDEDIVKWFYCYDDVVRYMDSDKFYKAIKTAVDNHDHDPYEILAAISDHLDSGTLYRLSEEIEKEEEKEGAE